jgi:hypothetical protein
MAVKRSIRQNDDGCQRRTPAKALSPYVTSLSQRRVSETVQILATADLGFYHLYLATFASGCRSLPTTTSTFLIVPVKVNGGG